MFRDHFGAAADTYRKHRPRYPETLFDHLAERSSRRETAWDCATGSGQVAVSLAKRFRRVVATDASIGQIAHAERGPGASFAAATAEAAPIDSASVDLITVGQALHWFDLQAFYEEVRRILRPAGLLAVWTYSRLRISPEVDRQISKFHDEIVSPYWPRQRRHVEEGYASLSFPFEILARPELAMQTSWTVDELLGYLASWSSVLRYRERTGKDPLADLAPALRQCWGEGQELEVRWPLTVWLGRAP